VDRGAAPAEDALVHVADGTHERRLSANQLDEFALSDIGVLILVEDEVAEAGPRPGEHLRPLT
jgi:hypothetical protein